jgi:hypothetical protein
VRHAKAVEATALSISYPKSAIGALGYLRTYAGVEHVSPYSRASGASARAEACGSSGPDEEEEEEEEEEGQEEEQEMVEEGQPVRRRGEGRRGGGAEGRRPPAAAREEEAPEEAQAVSAVFIRELREGFYASLIEAGRGKDVAKVRVGPWIRGSPRCTSFSSSDDPSC